MYMIRRFRIDGVIGDDSDFIRLRSQYENLLTQHMRGEGFVPVLDLNPVFLTSYENDKYTFALIMYGMNVGKDDAWTVEGVSDGKRLPRSTRQTK